MNMKKALLSLFIAFAASSAMAQTGVASGTAYGHGADSIRCAEKLSLFSSFTETAVKHDKEGNVQKAKEDFKSAYDNWKVAISECPASSKNIYIHGAKIMAYRIKTETDPTKKKTNLDELMNMYDLRAKYFGDSKRYGRDYIMSMKLTDYFQYAGQYLSYQQAYDWAKPVVEVSGKTTDPSLLYYFVLSSFNIAKKDVSKQEAYIQDYLAAADVLDQQMEAAQGQEDMLKYLEGSKANLDAQFAASGLAGCDMLQKIYTIDKIEKSKENKRFLSQVCVLFERADCKTPVYFKAARYLFDIEPSANAAMGLASQSFNNHKYAEAKEYLVKAIELTDKVKEKVACYEFLASISSKQGLASAARSYSNKALELDPKSGRSLITLATLIAGQASNIFPSDKVKQKAVYYLVIDKLHHAAAVDPSVRSQANSLIAQYKKYLPSASDVFMHPDLDKGASFTVPGYGTTTIK